MQSSILPVPTIVAKTSFAVCGKKEEKWCEGRTSCHCVHKTQFLCIPHPHTFSKTRLPTRVIMFHPVRKTLRQERICLIERHLVSVGHRSVS